MFITAVSFILLIKPRWPKTKTLYDLDLFLSRSFLILQSLLFFLNEHNGFALVSSF